MWPGSREGATVVPADQVRPPGVSDSERRREELQEMKTSQQVAAAVALRELGYKVVATPQARNPVAYEARPACCGSSSCIPICPVQAKYDATVHVAQAERAGARLIENAVAHRIEIGPDGLPSAPTQFVADPVQDRLPEIRMERPGASRVEVVNSLKRLEEHFLDDVVGVGHARVRARARHHRRGARVVSRRRRLDVESDSGCRAHT